MKSSNIIPMEIRGYFIDDKLCVFSNLNFQWNVGIIYIQRLHPNFKFHSKSEVQLQ